MHALGLVRTMGSCGFHVLQEKGMTAVERDHDHAKESSQGLAGHMPLV